MVVLLVVFTILLFVLIDFFIQRKKKIGLEAQPHFQTMPLSRVFNLVPSGIFLQPTFTWSKILEDNELVVGIHPVLMGLVGEPDELQVMKPGEKVEKGDVLLRVQKGTKVLHVKAPVNGSITAINQEILDDPTWENISKNWLYMIKPKNVAAEVPSWFIAEKAQQWTNEKYNQIKSFFMQTAPQTEMGITMADGGDIPVGILSQFDDKIWKDFESTFCNQN